MQRCRVRLYITKGEILYNLCKFDESQAAFRKYADLAGENGRYYAQAVDLSSKIDAGEYTNACVSKLEQAKLQERDAKLKAICGEPLKARGKTISTYSQLQKFYSARTKACWREYHALGSKCNKAMYGRRLYDESGCGSVLTEARQCDRALIRFNAKAAPRVKRYETCAKDPDAYLAAEKKKQQANSASAPGRATAARPGDTDLHYTHKEPLLTRGADRHRVERLRLVEHRQGGLAVARAAHHDQATAVNPTQALAADGHAQLGRRGISSMSGSGSPMGPMRKSPATRPSRSSDLATRALPRLRRRRASEDGKLIETLNLRC